MTSLIAARVAAFMNRSPSQRRPSKDHAAIFSAMSAEIFGTVTHFCLSWYLVHGLNVVYASFTCY